MLNYFPKSASFFFLSLCFLFLHCSIAMNMKRKLVEKDLRHQKNSIDMVFIRVPAGSFRMGCSDDDSDCATDEKPAHEVAIQHSFWMSAHEVTNQDFGQFISETAYQTDAESLHLSQNWRNCHIDKDFNQLPVSCVTYNDARAFAKWLSKKEKISYRLPTEAEWEYAARAGFFTRYSWGLDMASKRAHYNKNSNRKPAPVGQLPANSWGFFDMAGNVWEWCQDYYQDDFYTESRQVNPLNDSGGKGRVLRGGSWFDSFLMLRVSTREFAPAMTVEDHYGFRLVHD